MVGRLVLVAGGLLVALYAAWLFGAYVGVLPLPIVRLDTAMVERWFEVLRVGALNGVIVATVTALLATLGVALAVVGARGAADLTVLPSPPRVPGEPGGAVSISNASVCACGRHAAEEVAGVHANAARARLRGRKGWQIDLGITVDPAANVPDLVQQIRAKLNASLEHQTGLPLATLRVRAELERPNDRRAARLN